MCIRDRDYIETEGDNYFDYSTDEQHSEGEGVAAPYTGTVSESKATDKQSHICFNESAQVKPCNNILAQRKCKSGLRTPMKKVDLSMACLLYTSRCV